MIGNILVGPNNSIWLIDFGHTRDGHTLFDWATLEVSLLGDALAGIAESDWGTVQSIIKQLLTMDNDQTRATASKHVLMTVEAIVALRNVIHECLSTEDNWYEYYIALALCALRGPRGLARASRWSSARCLAAIA